MKLLLGNCLEQMKSLDENSVDAIVTDPPYGLSFMNKHWDYDVPTEEIWREALRVLKPGGHLLSFFGTRTYHRGVVRIEDAGFEIRDQIAWLYGQGFPKSTNVLKSGLKQGLFCECKRAESNTESQVSYMSDAGISQAISTSETKANSLQSSLSKQDVCISSYRTESKEGLTNGEKSGLERRSDLQKKQRELHRPEVRKMSKGISSDVSQGRIYNGTSFDNGETSKQNFTESGSCSPQGPQYKKQFNSESGIISEQSSAQTCRSCGKKICDSGLGTSLKPSIEPIVLARKPLEKGLTVAENVLKYGTGAINIDESRIEISSDDPNHRKPSVGWQNAEDPSVTNFGSGGRPVENLNTQGRWPANIIFDEDAASMLDEQSGNLAGRGNSNIDLSIPSDSMFGNNIRVKPKHENNGGGASRFFYVAKASKRERGEGNGHPTVKPIKLMQYLIKLVTPPNGTVLDPFMGSGSTGVAAKNLGFNFIGCEMNEEYFEIAKKRIGV